MLIQPQIPAASTAPLSLELDQSGEVWVLRTPLGDSYEQLRARIAKELESHAAGLRGRNLRLDLGERSLDLFEIRRIATLLREGFEAAVIAIECSSDSIHRYTETAFKLPMLTTPVDTRPRMPLGFTGAPLAEVFEMDEDESIPTDLPELEDVLPGNDVQTPLIPEMDEIPEVEDTDIIEAGALVPSEAGRRTMVVERTLRSGNIIRFAGDVMVYGDVNAGAHIEADGNILVFGSLRGLAHAGARGDERAVVMAFELRPSQIRIADLIGFTPEPEPEPEEPQGMASKFPEGVVGGLSNLLKRARPAARTFSPEIAWISGGEILIDEYRGRLPS